MGIGRGHGENRATDAAKAAIASPLLEVSMDGAKSVLISITGGSNLTLQEVHEAATLVTKNADPDATVIWGTAIDEGMKDDVKITVVATGFERHPIGSMAGSPVRRPLSTPAPTPSKPVETRPAQPASNEPLPRMDLRSPRIPNNPVPTGFGSPMPMQNQVKAVEPEPEVMEEPAPAPAPAPRAEPKMPNIISRALGKSSAPAPAAPAAPKTVASEDDDLDAIPSFIRKKMM